eukprot:5352379-Amphidinium_carterae.3
MRSRGFACILASREACADWLGGPYHALVRQLAVLEAQGMVASGSPLFPNIDGKVAGSEMVGVVLWAPAALSLPLTGRQGEQIFGGHSWRVSGARYFAVRTKGVEVTTIKA